MNGLEIAKDFYFSWGKPRLESAFPELNGRIAVGRVTGSDVIGADDALSTDHNWGPQFTIFLSEADFSAHGEKVSNVMNEAAPNPWNGYRLDGAGDKSVQVESIPDWMKTWLGFSHVPSRNEDWVGGIDEARESTLYFLRHGAVWVDGSGELSRWREALHFYPEPIWRNRLAEELFRVWQHGEYNFVQRIAKRGNPLAVAMCIGIFVSSVMRTLLLLNRDYAPYWKWLAHEFRKLNEAQHFAPLLERLVSDPNPETQSRIVLDVCDGIYQRLRSAGIITGQNDNQHLLPLLNAHLELLATAQGDSPNQ